MHFYPQSTKNPSVYKLKQKIMTEQLFKEITAWQKEVFGQATPVSKMNHLKQEVDELLVELENWYKTGFPKSETQLQDLLIEKEFADCFFLLFGAAAAHGMSYQDIIDCIQLKFEINKKRKWGKPDKNGVVNHINP